MEFIIFFFVNWTPLFVACESGKLDIVSLLLKKSGINVNAQTNDGMTPLFVAAMKGFDAIVVRLLSVPGINVNAREYQSGIFFLCFFNKTALHAAAENNHLHVVKILLYNEVTEVSAKTFDGIHLFVSFIKLLLI